MRGPPAGRGASSTGSGPGRSSSASALPSRSGFPAGLPGLAGLGAAAGLTVVLGIVWQRWLGGVTGDLLGATAKLAETAILVTALAVL